MGIKKTPASETRCRRTNLLAECAAAILFSDVKAVPFPGRPREALSRLRCGAHRQTRRSLHSKIVAILPYRAACVKDFCGRGAPHAQFMPKGGPRFRDGSPLRRWRAAPRGASDRNRQDSIRNRKRCQGSCLNGGRYTLHVQNTAGRRVRIWRFPVLSASYALHFSGTGS